MGGNSSVENNTETVTNIVSESVVSILQDINTKQYGDQNFSVDCSDINLTKELNDSMLACQKDAYLQRKEGGALADFDSERFSTYIHDNCVKPRMCYAGNINMSQTIRSVDWQQITGENKDTLEQELKEKLNSNTDAKTGFMRFGDKTTNSIKSTNSQLASATLNVAQHVTKSWDNSQSMTLKGYGTIEFVTEEQAIDTLSKALLQNSTTNALIAKQAKEISSIVKSGGSDIMKYIKIFAVIIGCIILLLIIWKVIQYFRNKNKKNKLDQDKE